MAKSESQNAAILAHLKAGRSITQLEALRLFGCLRLSGRIFDLRAAGHKINMEREQDPATGKYWGRYSYIAKEQPDANP